MVHSSIYVSMIKICIWREKETYHLYIIQSKITGYLFDYYKDEGRYESGHK